MLAIDWKFWKSYLLTSSAKHITIKMVGRIAALRELFRDKLGSHLASDFSSGELTREIVQGEKEDIKVEVQLPNENNDSADSAEASQKSPGRSANVCGSFIQLSDAADEFFDTEPSDYYDDSEVMWPAEGVLVSQDQCQPKLYTAAVFVRKLHDLAVQKRGYVDLREMTGVDSPPCSYGATLPKDPACNLACSWNAADPSTFLIRGETSLHDHQKVKANGMLMQMVAADWLQSDKREDDLGGRPGGIVQ